MINWLIEEGDEKIMPWESLLKQSRPSQEMANAMNKAFLEPLKEHHLSCTITHLALEKDSPEFIEVSEYGYEKFYQISIPLNWLAQTRFQIGFCKNMPTSLPF